MNTPALARVCAAYDNLADEETHQKHDGSGDQEIKGLDRSGQSVEASSIEQSQKSKDGGQEHVDQAGTAVVVILVVHTVFVTENIRLFPRLDLVLDVLPAVQTCWMAEKFFGIGVPVLRVLF